MKSSFILSLILATLGGTVCAIPFERRAADTDQDGNSSVEEFEIKVGQMRAARDAKQRVGSGAKKQ